MTFILKKLKFVNGNPTRFGIISPTLRSFSPEFQSVLVLSHISSLECISLNGLSYKVLKIKMAQNNTNLFFHNLEARSLKLRCQQGHTPFEDAREELILASSCHLVATQNPWCFMADPSLSLCLCLHIAFNSMVLHHVFSIPHLLKAPVWISTYPNSVWSHFNLITSTKTLFANNFTFQGSGRHKFEENILKPSIQVSLEGTIKPLGIYFWLNKLTGNSILFMEGIKSIS
jgi:hypothetical protein